AVPNPVLGGVTTLQFASVVVWGVRMLAYNRFTPRDCFVLTAALLFGPGTSSCPT
ncbi:uncharacterized protein B0H18DRAFT_855391, partial [Fomitopsis serialis]|uniref:uncharacterized protein n=1 Tax=Fomitopsis serialis TaxID=139415 RepID=UPI002007FBF6